MDGTGGIIMILDVTSGVKKIQNLLGIDGWNLSSCSYTVPRSLDSLDTDTVTFLDMTGVLQQLGLNLDLSAIPIAQTLANAINDPTSLPFYPKTQDKAGRTYLEGQKDTFKNQLMIYKLPNNRPIVQYWGSEVTTFSVTTLLSGENYLDKLRFVRKVLTTDLDETGGTFSHPLYGIFDNTFVDNFNVTTLPTPFNASLVEITFVTAANGAAELTKPSTLSAINTYVNNALNVLSVVGSLGSIAQQLKSLYPSSFFPSSAFAGVKNEFIQVEKINNNHSKGRKTDLQQTNPALASAVSQLNAAGIPLDYDPVQNSQIIIEKSAQYVGTVVSGYGRGGLSKSDTETLVVVNPDSFKDGTTTSVDGTVTAVSYQNLGKNSDGSYNLRKTSVVTTPIAIPNTVSELQAMIADLIIVGGVMSKLNSNLYYTYTQLISSLEQLIDETFKSGTDTQFTLKEDMIPQEIASRFNMGLTDLFSLNNNLLIGHRKLRKGMSLTVNQGGF
jgi:hypothetical protein